MDMQQTPFFGWWITGQEEHGARNFTPGFYFWSIFATQFLGDYHPSALQALSPHRVCSMEVSPACELRKRGFLSLGKDRNASKTQGEFVGESS